MRDIIKNEVVRWVALTPGAVVGYFVGVLVIDLFDFIQGIFSQNWSDNWKGVLQSGAASYAFVYFGGFIAPKFKRNICVILGTLISSATLTLFLYAMIAGNFPLRKDIWYVVDIAATLFGSLIAYTVMQDQCGEEWK